MSKIFPKGLRVTFKQAKPLISSGWLVDGLRYLRKLSGNQTRLVPYDDS
jgi:hypothetical protein